MLVNNKENLIFGQESLRAFSLNLVSYISTCECGSIIMVAGGANSFLLPLFFIKSLSNNDGKGNETKKGI